jgi:hypothetical protein
MVCFVCAEIRAKTVKLEIPIDIPKMKGVWGISPS